MKSFLHRLHTVTSAQNSQPQAQPGGDSGTAPAGKIMDRQSQSRIGLICARDVHHARQASCDSSGCISRLKGGGGGARRGTVVESWGLDAGSGSLRPPLGQPKWVQFTDHIAALASLRGGRRAGEETVQSALLRLRLDGLGRLGGGLRLLDLLDLLRWLGRVALR